MNRKDYDFSVLSVLVVEDSEHMRNLLDALLDAMGIGHVLLAKNGAEGFEVYRQELPDIIITDAAMEPLSGYDLTRQIRTDKSNPNPFVPIIMLSGHLEQSKIERARDTGATEYLAKPVSATTIYERIVSVIEKPRTFVRTSTYFGPDRRRHMAGLHFGPKRRAKDYEIDAASAGKSKGRKKFEYINPPNYLLAKVTKSVEAMRSRRSKPPSPSEKLFDAEKIGGMAHTIQEAQASFSGLMQEQMAHIRSLIWLVESGNRVAIEELYDHLHELRGLAGTFKFEAVGRIANSLCIYLARLPDRTYAEMDVLQPHFDALTNAYMQGQRMGSATRKVVEALESLVARSAADQPTETAGNKVRFI